jgi:hypothetical protein
VSTPEERVRAERAAALLVRLIRDPSFRAAFRRKPAEEARAFGLDQLARELEERQKERQTLPIRETKARLAGLLLATADEGVAAANLVGLTDRSPSGHTARTAKRVLTSAGFPGDRA